MTPEPPNNGAAPYHNGESDTGTPAANADVAGEHWNKCLLKIGATQDRKAFIELFRHFAPRVKGYFLSQPQLLFDSDCADELVQEAMLKVWQKARSFDPDKAGAGTWIYTIARNCRIDMLRRRQRVEAAPVLETDEVWPPEEENEPSRLLHHLRNRETMQASLRTLPEDQSCVLAKIYMEGKTHAEVATELQLPLGTVKSRMRLALKKMKLLLHR